MLNLLGDNFDWPRLIVRSATVVLAVGLLATLVLAWYHSEKGQQRVSGPELLMLASLPTGGVRLARVGREGW